MTRLTQVRARNISYVQYYSSGCMTFLSVYKYSEKNLFVISFYEYIENVEIFV